MTTSNDVGAARVLHFVLEHVIAGIIIILRYANIHITFIARNMNTVQIDAITKVSAPNGVKF